MFYTVAEMNPARSFTPAMFKRNFMNHWVYWVGPMICGAMGTIMYDFMLFPCMHCLAERVATLKGSRPLEQDPCVEAIKLKTYTVSLTPSQEKQRPARLIIVAPLLPATHLFSSQQSSSPPQTSPLPRHQQPATPTKD
ncbi:lens fiber major intrinsic protein-like [Engraulis encrasicolus]|uniref:lens fiber major intrinsic protein-like n=1 Tax=Engraulis encrasicolus TaxID=184585 RepID=UPI002FD4CC26